MAKVTTGRAEGVLDLFHGIHEGDDERPGDSTETTPPRTSPRKHKTTTDDWEETPKRSGWGNSPVREISPRRMSNVQKAIFSMKSEAVSDENAFFLFIGYTLTKSLQL